jgi:hypothetical protein
MFMFDRERTRKPRLVGGVRGAILKEYIIRFAHESSIDSPSANESSISLPGSPALWAGSFTLVKWERSQTNTN